jgi:K+-transporting ATPase KdpF subunit
LTQSIWCLEPGGGAGVKVASRVVNEASTRPLSRPIAFTGSVIENAIAAVLGLALLAYLVYALVRPEKF